MVWYIIGVVRYITGIQDSDSVNDRVRYVTSEFSSEEAEGECHRYTFRVQITGRNRLYRLGLAFESGTCCESEHSALHDHHLAVTYFCLCGQACRVWIPGSCETA